MGDQDRHEEILNAIEEIMAGKRMPDPEPYGFNVEVLSGGPKNTRLELVLHFTGDNPNPLAMLTEEVFNPDLDKGATQHDVPIGKQDRGHLEMEPRKAVQWAIEEARRLRISALTVRCDPTRLDESA